MKEITLKISVEEANIMLEALGNLPFVKVYSLIGKIQEQAGQQIKTNGQVAQTESATQTIPPIES